MGPVLPMCSISSSPFSQIHSSCPVSLWHCQLFLIQSQTPFALFPFPSFFPSLPLSHLAHRLPCQSQIQISLLPLNCFHSLSSLTGFLSIIYSCSSVLHSLGISTCHLPPPQCNEIFEGARQRRSLPPFRCADPVQPAQAECSFDSGPCGGLGWYGCYGTLLTAQSFQVIAEASTVWTVRFQQICTFF